MMSQKTSSRTVTLVCWSLSKVLIFACTSSVIVRIPCKRTRRQRIAVLVLELAQSPELWLLWSQSGTEACSWYQKSGLNYTSYKNRLAVVYVQLQQLSLKHQFVWDSSPPQLHQLVWQDWCKNRSQRILSYCIRSTIVEVIVQHNLNNQYPIRKHTINILRRRYEKIRSSCCRSCSTFCFTTTRKAYTDVSTLKTTK